MQRDVWVELGLSRWRTTFSAIGTDPAAYCEYWYKSGTSKTEIQTSECVVRVRQRLGTNMANRLRLKRPVRVGRERGWRLVARRRQFPEGSPW